MKRSLVHVLPALLVASLARAQELPGARAESPNPAEDALETVVIVGTHIQGTQAPPAFPVTVITADQIAAVGAMSGDDVMRTIPQMGDVTFNTTNDQQTSNAARGDVASIDLRGSGLGDTLVLLNGRRIVEHPTSQSRGGVPLISYNAQALPTAGLQRVEVLRQGAAAIYGADAVAGVVNVITKTDVEGVTASVQYGYAEGTHRKESRASIVAGWDFGSSGNVSLILDALHRTAQRPSDEPYTSTQDLRPLFADSPGYNTSSAPDGRGNQSSFPALVARAANGGSRSVSVLQGTIPLTTTAGSFHVQPTALNGCATPIGNGLCIARGAVPYATVANNLRYDAYENDAVTIAPEVERGHASLNAHYDVASEHTLYTEIDYYHASSHALTTQPTALVPIGVPSSNYYNPFGPVTNLNRVPNLSNVPTAGLPLTFGTYRFNDLGPARVDVSSFQDRFLIGARGSSLWGFQYDSALLYGEAHVDDVSDGVDAARLANQLALSTPDAYNPFNGGCLDGSGGRDCTPSTQAALDAIRTRLRRDSTSTLINLDYKLSRSDLLHLPAGGAGLAMGLEARREGHTDRRDPRVSGEIPFSDPVLQTTSLSDAVGVNSTPSTHDSRNVMSLFGELAIPILSPGMNLAWARKLDMQLAGRLEHYSDFGDVVRPKAALTWEVINALVLRASWERGFKAPNLETTAQYTYARAQTVTDWYRCQAALNKHQIATFNACGENFGVTYTESGNPQLEPETSHSYDFGIVLQPRFFPGGWGQLTLAIDRWSLRQRGIVGVVGFDAIAVEDYFQRASSGSGSANLVRAAATADDIAFYSGSGLTPVGAPAVLSDRFKNLQPQTIAGIDLSLAWRKVSANVGTFEFSLDAAHLDRFTQPPSPEVQALFDARAAGVINAATPLVDAGNRLQMRGNPKWKGTATLTWSQGPFQVGSSLLYTASTLDTRFLSDAGAPWPVASLTTINLYGQYRFDTVGPLDRLRVKIGARNLLDRGAPLQSDGFNGALYQPFGRYLYFTLSASL